MATKTKPVEIKVDGTKLKTIAKMREYLADYAAAKDKVEELDAQIESAIEDTDESIEVQELEDSLKAAREKLRKVMATKSGFNDLLEERGLCNEKLKSIKRRLSDFLLGHYRQTGERQIEVGGALAREVILSGRLGKEKRYQTNLFATEKTDVES